MAHHHLRASSARLAKRRGILFTAEMVAAEFRLSARIKIRGKTSAAELVFSGQPGDGAFKGCSLSLGGDSRVNVWRYGDGPPQSVPGNTALSADAWHGCEITVCAGKAHIALNGVTAFDIDVPVGTRCAISGFLRGEQAQLAIKDLKLEVL